MPLRYISRLNFYRCSDGISQRKLSQTLKISRQALSALESAKTKPTLLVAHKIAAYFGVTIEDVFTFKDLKL